MFPRLCEGCGFELCNATEAYQIHRTKGPGKGDLETVCLECCQILLDMKKAKQYA